MHAIEKKKDIIPVIIPVTQFRFRERRKLHFRESSFTNFPGGGGGEGMPPDAPAPAVRTVHVRQLNHCIRYFQMLPKTLPKKFKILGFLQSSMLPLQRSKSYV